MCDELKPFLKVGQKWRIQEGQYYVADGEILEIYD
jgi:hypothetical protein